MLEKFIEFTKCIVNTIEFMEKFRKSKKDFIRNRKVSFAMNILLIFACLKRSIQTGIDQFIIDMDTEFDTYSKQAFSKGRQRILPEAFEELHRLSTEFFYKEADYKTYSGYRILAIDGSKIDLPYNEELKEIYGSQKSTNDLIQSLISCLTDVLNNVILDGIMAPCNGNERELAKQHILSLSKIKTDKDIILFDRGYPSAELMQYVDQAGFKYIMRCSTSFVSSISKKECTNDSIIKHKFKKNGKEVTFRILRFPISDDTTEILVTNIFEEFNISNFKEIYNMRWGIEKTYDCIKNKFGLESFSGTKPVCILQDFYANLYLYNTLAMLMYDNNKTSEKREKEVKYIYKINERQAVNKIRDNLIKAIMTESEIKRNKLFMKVYKQLQKELIPVRPNRAYKRKRKHPSVKFPQNQKC